MLTFNVNLTDGLVNGVLGTVLGFVHEASKVKAIIIAFDDPKVGLASPHTCLPCLVEISESTKVLG